jgi:hypothetical protein
LVSTTGATASSSALPTGSASSLTRGA